MSEGKATYQTGYIEVYATRERGRWRAGMQFTAEPVVLAVADLSESDLVALEADSLIVVNEVSADKAPVSDEEILAAIGELKPNAKSTWTEDGRPRVDGLEKALGRSITEADRDRVWERFQQEQA